MYFKTIAKRGGLFFDLRKRLVLKGDFYDYQNCYAGHLLCNYDWC